MPPLSHAELVSRLRARQLDRTLTTALPPLDPHDEYAIGPSGVTRLDEALGGGFPRGQLSEIVGARSSGRASLVARLLAAATARGELVALIDALDMLDVESAEAAGVDLCRLLWIRGHVVSHPGFCRDLNQRAMEQAVRALTLVLGAGNFGLVAFDVGDAPADALRRLPFTTWLRLQRMVEGRQTICVLVGNEPMARSSAGLTVRVGIRASGPSDPSTELRVDLSLPKVEAPGSPTRLPRWGGPSGGPSEGSAPPIRGPLFEGLDCEVRVIRARARRQEEASVAVTTVASHV